MNPSTLPVLFSLLAACSSSPPAVRQTASAEGPAPGRAEVGARPLEVRIRAEQLRNPYWYKKHGGAQEARQFWDRAYWERILGTIKEEGYNAVLYLPEAWLEHAWQTFLVRHREFPEARDLAAEESWRRRPR